MKHENMEYWRNPAINDVVLCKADISKFEFQQHVHLDYHIGVVSQGCQQYSHKGISYQLSPGSISTLNPDEVHNGHSVDPLGYQAHIMSIPYEYLVQISQELNHKEIFFSTPLVEDFQLQQAFLQLHQMLTTPQESSLLIETNLMAFITELFLRHGHMTPQKKHTNNGLSQLQVNYIRELFHDDLSQAFQLEDLARSLELSKFQFLRKFKQSVGMTPHAYLKRIRLEYAKKALIKGESTIEIAHNVGFFDQSHFNKAFKSAYLITPAYFQQRVL
ncbi:AraC family transcriptional regulator [Shewanella sp. VB17]|uniref:helix-turn-helix transcriptional regulator n=1 Tax=Shewanella sp. VB17 TaxID=2739432 RepID=UPI0020B82FEE|nr:AraC family transcriptional regulator [Shewanella sp. VB17]